MINCNFCNQETDNPKFCSRSCSVSASNKGKLSKNFIHGKWVKKPCLICNTLSKHKLCSRKCSSDYKKLDFERKMNEGLLNSLSHNQSIRKHLLRLRGHACEQCKLKTWYEQPIPLNVHHIDGNATNNSLDNLQLLCLNCHGLTDNYGFKNKNSTRNYRKKTLRVGEVERQ